MAFEAAVPVDDLLDGLAEVLVVADRDMDGVDAASRICWKIFGDQLQYWQQSMV